MSYYVADEETWTTVSNSPDPPYIHVREEAPQVAFVGDAESPFLLDGATPQPGADTTHTVAAVDADLQAGSVLCALHVEANRLDVEDRRSSDGQTRCGDAPFEDFRAALDEIVIPVYLDDAVETLSDGVDGLVAIHTAQYDDRVDRTCTYFRTAVFQDETLLLEEERGSL
jgi:hypothetical protein